MSTHHLIFEETTSPLYRSNDGRLALYHGAEDGEELPVYVVELDGTAVLETRQRVLVDAYIAGYDLARS